MSEVFFETLTNGHRPLVAAYLARGWKVRVFDFSYRLKTIPWLRRLLFDGKVERVYVHINSRADGLAIDAAEALYPRFSDHPLVRRLAVLYGSEEVSAPFKHSLTESLSRYFFCRLYLERHTETHPDSHVHFVPDSYRSWDRLLRDWCAQQGIPPLRDARMPRMAAGWSEAVHACGQWAERARRYAAIAGGLLLVAVGRLRKERSANAEPITLPYVYAIDSKFQTKFEAGRRFDFLLDGSHLTRENTLFLVSPGAEGPWLAPARRQGCRILLRSNNAGARGLLARPPRTLPLGSAWRAALEGFLRIFSSEWLHGAATTGLSTLLQELPVLERLRFSHYIYTSQYRLTPRWRNALIRRRGAQSWCFAYSNGGGFLYRAYGPFAGDGDFAGPHRFWAYENADHFVSPCRDLLEYHRLHRQQVRQYHDVGNIWSEQILEVERNQDLEGTRRQWFGPSVTGKKVIAWFDTTFVEAPNCPSTISEAVLWYRDILRLVQEDERFFMVIKPSKDEGYYVSEEADRQWAIPRIGRGLMEVWQALKAHPRVRFLQNSDDPTCVVAASDLTVTFCFSSVSAEALGARKPGIWYEPGQRWRDTLLGREPLLTAHGYEELTSLVRRLIFEMSLQEYGLFLDRTARGLVESRLDGKGVTRFRDLLCGRRADSEVRMSLESALRENR